MTRPQEELVATCVVIEANDRRQVPASRVNNSLSVIRNEEMPHFEG